MRRADRPRGLPAVFRLQALLSFSIAVLFIFALSKIVLGNYPASTAVSLGYAINLAFYCTIFGMWLLFGILFMVLKFKIIAPISRLTSAMRTITAGRKWGERVETKENIREFDSLVDDFNRLVDAVEKDRAMLRESSIRDSLTGLLNRRGFEESLLSELERSKRFEKPFSVVLIDMDNFKYINDTYGHPAGDYILRGMTARLQQVLRSVDSFARIGGDEFLLILPSADAAAGLAVANKLHSELTRANFSVGREGDVQIPISASIGVATYPKDGLDSTSLHQAVDAVLYKAKRAGKNCVVSLGEDDVPDLLSRPSKLRHAIEDGRIEAAFQPIVTISDGKIVAYEALARIRDGDELWSASSFIDAISEPGLAKKIDASVMRKGLEFMCSAPDAEYRIFFNLSSASFSDMEWMLGLPEYISNTGVSCSRIVLEITERDALPRMDGVRHIISELRKTGIRFALDDFGTGFSSFSYARQLDVDFLKIDGSFVRNVAKSRDDRTIVEAIHRFAQDFGLTTIAEYVEDEDAVRVLSEIGIDTAQGFHFGLPETPSYL